MTPWWWRWAGPLDSFHCIQLHVRHGFCKRGGRWPSSPRVEVALPCCRCTGARDSRYGFFRAAPLMRHAALSLVKITVNEARCLKKGRLFKADVLLPLFLLSVVLWHKEDIPSLYFTFWLPGCLTHDIHRKITSLQETYIFMGYLPF